MLDNTQKLINQINIVDNGNKLGIIHQTINSKSLNDRSIEIKNQQLINFSSCSYLGLEFDSRIIDSICEAAHRFGSQNSISRIYLDLEMYKELEYLLSLIFKRPTIACSSTSMGHIIYMPNIISKNDLVICDLQAHSSLQSALTFVEAKGTPVKRIHHSDINALEQLIIKHKDTYTKIWYIIDGIYSMYGDFAPAEDILQLLYKYEQLHIYCDDAHAMAWTGQNGSGYFLNATNHHPRVYIATSLNKGFAGSGGALIMPDQASKDMLMNVSSPLMFNGPIQPPMLGANIASSKILLYGNVSKLQNELYHKIIFFKTIANVLGLKIQNDDNTPIFYVECPYTICLKLTAAVMQHGFFVNACTYPGVPIKNSGIRIIINRIHTFENIENLIRTIVELLPTISNSDDDLNPIIDESFSD